MEKSKTITVERRDGVLLIGLDRPEKMNAFNLQMLGELARAYSELERDEALRCGLLFAWGKCFTAGLDLAEVGPAVASGAPLFPLDEIDPFDLAGARRTKPIVCAVHGLCLTIGVELLLASEIALASPETRFGQIEVKRGIMAFGGGTFRWPARVGYGNAMRYLLTGDELSGAEAHRIGLVQELAPADELFDRALSIARAIATQAPLAVQETLAAAREATTMERTEHGAATVGRARRLMATEDAREGLMSFIERREARFQGR